MNNRGFTLIELLAVIAIIGIVSGTAVAGVQNNINKSHENYCTSTSDMMVLSGRDYFNDNRNQLPSEVGSEKCVYLTTLESEKYIDSLLDYEENKCNSTTSKVCVIKQTNSKYYYTKYLDCNKCNENNEKETKNIKASIVYSPNTKESSNEDINVKVEFNGNGSKIISYKYDIYEKTTSGDVRVRGIEYKEYKEDNLEIKLNSKGTYYIVTTVINEYGNKTEQRSGEYKLTYDLSNQCKDQISVYARSSGSTIINGSTNLEERKWYNGDFTIYIKKKGTIYSYDVYVKKSQGEYERVIEKATSDKTIKYNKNRVLDNTRYQTENITTETQGYRGTTDTYEIYVVGYDEYGQSCTTRKYNYYQDNTDPTCKTDSTTSEAGKYASGAKYTQGEWVNQNVLLTGTCSDDRRTAGEVNSGCKGNTSKKIEVLKNNYYNDTPTSGTVYDNAGNSIVCPYEKVRIDKIDPVCTSNGGSSSWYNTDRTITGTCKEDNKDVKNSGCRKGTNSSVSGDYDQTYDDTGKVTLVKHKENDGDISPGIVYDIAGNSTVCAVQTVKIDKTAPRCVSSGGNNSWTNKSITLTGTCYDDQSTINSKCTDNASVTYKDNTNGTYSPGTVYDNAGNSTACAAQTVKIDKTPPTCTSSGGSNTWYNTDRTITGTCSDTGGSGCVDNVSQKYTDDRNDTYSPGTVYDKAGNSKKCSKERVKIDKTKPYTPWIDRNYSEATHNNLSICGGPAIYVNKYGTCTNELFDTNVLPYKTANCNRSSCVLQFFSDICFTSFKCSSTSKTIKGNRNCRYIKKYACGATKRQYKNNDGGSPVTMKSETVADGVCNGSASYSVVRWWTEDDAGNKSGYLTKYEYMKHCTDISFSNSPYKFDGGKIVSK